MAACEEHLGLCKVLPRIAAMPTRQISLRLSYVTTCKFGRLESARLSSAGA